MDPGWDHTENEDKHLLTQNVGMLNQNITNDPVTDISMATIFEFINHLSNVVISIVNHYLILLAFYINYYIYFSYDKNRIYHIYDMINNFIIRSSTDSKINSINYLKNLIHKFSSYKDFNILEYTNTYSLLYNLNLYEINYFIISFVHYSINEFKSNVFVYEETSFYYDIPQILSSGIRCCCCICCYECVNKNGEESETTDPLCNNINNYRFYVRSMADNHGNNLCLCLVTKYLLFGNVRTLLCYIRDIVGDLYSSVSRRFDKYTHSTAYMFSVGKLIMLLIKVVYKVTLWMKLKYLCTCPPGCPCCCPTGSGAGSCSSGCYVCSQAPVPCCSCLPKPNNCNNGTVTNNCCCKCKSSNATSCCSCRSCNSGGCCRCCCNCFCKNHDDPYYPYLISIILFVSSLVENIWTMDSQNIRIAIEKLSSLLSEYQSLHVYTNYYTPSRYNVLRNILSVTKNGKSTEATLSHYGSGIVDKNNKSLLIKSTITTRLTKSEKSSGTTTYALSTLSGGLVNGSTKLAFKSLRTIILGTRFSKESFGLIYGKFSSLTFYTQNSKVINTGTNKNITKLGITISLKYLDEICKREECNEICQKIGVCKICPIAKIRINCLSISFKDMGLIIGNVSADMLLNYLKGSINISEDFMTNLCVGFGEVYAIMLKNQPISSSGYSNLRSYGSNMGVKDASTTNWGYDTGYEHSITILSNNYKGDEYPDINNPFFPML